MKKLTKLKNKILDLIKGDVFTIIGGAYIALSIIYNLLLPTKTVLSAVVFFSLEMGLVIYSMFFIAKCLDNSGKILIALVISAYKIASLLIIYASAIIHWNDYVLFYRLVNNYWILLFLSGLVFISLLIIRRVVKIKSIWNG